MRTLQNHGGGYSGPMLTPRLPSNGMNSQKREIRILVLLVT